MQFTDQTVTTVESSSLFNKTLDRGRSIFSLLTSNAKFTIGICIVLFFVLAAILAPLLTPYDPSAIVVHGAHAPSAAHPIGTTALGQDLLSQLLYGARITLLVSFTAAIGSIILQVAFGMSAAYFGGVVDDVLTLIINVILVLPSLPLTIVIASLASASNSGSNNEIMITLVLLFTSWPYGARVLRAQTLTMKEREFVAAARASGESPLRLIFAEIMPNEVALIASNFVGTFVYAIGAEVALEFLGLGNTLSSSWGVILYWAQNGGALLTGKWWLFVPAGLCVAVLCAALTFINFGIDELANPRLRRDKTAKAARALKKEKKEAIA